MTGRPVMRYHGGKHKLAAWIIGQMPEHRVYVEPFAGAASVLMQKPRSYAEVYNDLDHEIVNVFKVLRDPAMAARLQEVCELTPFARDEFTEPFDGRLDRIERARRTLFRSVAGFGSAAANADYKTGFRSNSSRSRTTPAMDWVTYTQNIVKFTTRLRGVVIENKDAFEVIPEHDAPGTLFYVDPPYVGSTRTASGRGGQYRHEMTDAHHEELAALLRGVKGMVMLSGYRCELYDRLYGDWERVDRIHLADKAAVRVESLWFSPNAKRPQMSILEVDDVEEGSGEAVDE